MSTAFALAIERTLKHEGLFVDHKNDPGGATNYGISLRWLKDIGDLDGDGFLDGDLDHDGDVDVNDIKIMTKEQAVQFYKVHFWDKNGYDRFHSGWVAAKVFDMTVNMGAVQAHKCLQRACRAANGDLLVDDGIIGSKTINSVNNASDAMLMAAIRSEVAGFYRLLVAKNDKFKDFITGWLNRAYS